MAKVKIRHGLLSVSVYRAGEKVGQAIYAAGGSGWVVNSLRDFRELARFPATEAGQKLAINFILDNLP